jgi:serine/threonine protein kinase/Tol biopolymer transport system component
MGLTAGTKLGPYEIQSPLGAGGMGEVYRARDTRLDRTVAIKILPEHLSSNPDAKQRFEREARVISSLNHPNICHLYDIGSQDGVDFLVMEFLEGENLGDRLKKGPLPTDQLLKCGREICEGLEKAHKSGVVHRDLKPGNIMLTKAGTKLMDFGLAKAVDEANPPSSGLTATIASGKASQPLTAQGTVVGTFQYISPEQLEAKEADARSDIFALGTVLYEMATGKRAFEGKTTASVIAAVMERDPAPISTVQPMSPPTLDRVVKTCMAKDPDERFQTVHDVKLQLKWIVEGGSQAGVPAPVAARRRNREGALAATAVFCALVAAVFGFAYFHRPSNDAPAIRSSILPPANSAFLYSVATSGYALSADGTRLAFTAQSPDGVTRIWLRPLNSTNAQELSGTDNGGLPFWSPDGRWIGFFADGKLKKVAPEGGGVQVICDAPSGRGGTWNAQSVIVFAPSIGGPLHRVSANGGVSTPVTQLDASLGESTHRWPDFLPDGVHFLYLGRQISDLKSSAIYIGSLNELSHKKIFDSFTEAHYAAPGYLVFGRRTTLFAQRFDPGSFDLTGEAVPLAQDAAIQPNIIRTGFSVSQTGELVYGTAAGVTDMELIVIDRSGKQLLSLETGGAINGLRLSPDGQKLAVTEGDLVNGGSAIWTYDLRSKVRSRFTFGNAINLNPVWSPDSQQIALGSSRNETYAAFNVYLKPATGAGEEQAVHPSPVDERPQSWSPDGKFLIVDSRRPERQNNTEVAILPLSGDRKPFPYLSAPSISYGGEVSRDGRWLAYTSMESGRSTVYVSSFPQPKGKWQVSPVPGLSPHWRHDGRELFFCGTDGILSAAEVTLGKDSITVGSVRQIFDRHVFLSAYSAGYDVFPDGQRFVMSSLKPQALHAPLTLITNWPSELKK